MRRMGAPSTPRLTIASALSDASFDFLRGLRAVHGIQNRREATLNPLAARRRAGTRPGGSADS